MSSIARPVQFVKRKDANSMDKRKLINKIAGELETASAAQCDIVLTFLQHLTGSDGRDEDAPGRAFYFTEHDAVETAYIIRRNRNDSAFLHKLLVRAMLLEKLAAKGRAESQK